MAEAQGECVYITKIVRRYRMKIIKPKIEVAVRHEGDKLYNHCSIRQLSAILTLLLLKSR